MAARLRTLVIQQRRSEAVLAGLHWQSILETELRKRERMVDDAVKAQSIDLMCVIEFEAGLQLGYCERMRLPLTEQRNVRWFSFAMLVRRYFETRSLLLVWRVQTESDISQYAVVVFEENILLLDRVVDSTAVRDIVSSYLQNAGKMAAEERLTNDTEQFPDFVDISSIDWLHESSEVPRLRPPRAIRLIDAERRPVQAIFIILLLVCASLVIAWSVWSALAAKPATNSAKPKVTPQEQYIRSVTEQAGTLGLNSDGVRDLIMELMEMPLISDGWQLTSVNCDLTQCTSAWSGVPGADPRSLEALGKPLRESRSSKPGHIQISRPHRVSTQGVVSTDSLRSKADAILFCQREKLILTNLKVKSTLDCTGKTWPEKGPKIAADMMVARYGFRLAADWVTVDRLLDRYEDALFWRELKLSVTPGAKDIADFMTFEIAGGLYGYR